MLFFFSNEVTSLLDADFYYELLISGHVLEHYSIVVRVPNSCFVFNRFVIFINISELFVVTRDRQNPVLQSKRTSLKLTSFWK